MFFGCLPCCGTTCGAGNYGITAESFLTTGEVSVTVGGTANGSEITDVSTTSPFAMEWNADYQFGGYFPLGSDSVFSNNYQSASLPGELSNYRWNFNVRIDSLTPNQLGLNCNFGQLTNGSGAQPFSQLNILGTYRYYERRTAPSVASSTSRALFTSTAAQDSSPFNTNLSYYLSDRLCVERNTAAAAGYSYLFPFGSNMPFTSFTSEPGPTGQCNAWPLSVLFSGTSRNLFIGQTLYRLTFSGYFRIDQFLWYDASGNANELSQAPYNPPAGASPIPDPIRGGMTEYVSRFGTPI